MSININAFDHREWASHNLQDYGDFSDRISECNQEEMGDHTIGEWFYIPDEPLSITKDNPNERRVIYNGTWGNDNSPGASSYTWATIYDMTDPDDVAEYEKLKKQMEDAPEWLTEYEECECCHESYNTDAMTYDDKDDSWHCEKDSSKRKCVDCDEQVEEGEMIFVAEDEGYLCAGCKKNREEESER